MEQKIDAFTKALNRVQGLVEPVKKDSINPHFKSRYASLAAVNESVMPLLLENGFTLTQGGIEIAGRPWLRTVLTYQDGSNIHFDYPLVVSENPQHTASATSYARRYSICALLNLSVEDDDAEVAANHARNNSAAIPTTTREPATEAPAKSNKDVVQFIPKDVTTRQVEIKKGKNAGQTVTGFTIIDPQGNKYSTLDETGGQIAEKAAEEKKEIAFVVEVNGNFMNAKGIRFVEKVLEEVPF